MDYKLDKDIFILNKINEIRKIKKQELKNIENNNTQNLENKGVQINRSKNEYKFYNEIYFLNICSSCLDFLSVLCIMINIFVQNFYINIISLGFCSILRIFIIIRYFVMLGIKKIQLFFYSTLFTLDILPIILSYTSFNILSIIFFTIFNVVFIFFAFETYIKEISEINFSIYEYDSYLSQHLIFLFLTAINFLINDIMPLIVFWISIITLTTTLILKLLVIKRDKHSYFLKYVSIVTILQTFLCITMLIIYCKLELSQIELLISIFSTIFSLCIHNRPKIAKLIQQVNPDLNCLKISCSDFKNLNLNNTKSMFFKNISNETLLFEAIEIEFITFKTCKDIVIKPEVIFSLELDENLLKSKYGYKLFFKINSSSHNYVIDLTYNEKANSIKIDNYPA
ncbi:MAG: hypothetical protein ACI4TZ_03025 [Christensenellales bacterium]